MPSTSPKDTTEAEFIKYLNGKTVVFNNLIITGLLLVRTHGCKQSDSRLHSDAKLTNANFMQDIAYNKSQNKTIFKHLESDTVPLL